VADVEAFQVESKQTALLRDVRWCRLHLGHVVWSVPGFVLGK